MPIASATAQTSLPRGLMALFAPSAGIVLVCLLWFTAGTLLVRRWAGAFEVPLSAWGLLGVGLIAATLAAAVRLLWWPFRRSSVGSGREFQQNTLRAIPTLALLMLGAALSLPDTSLLGLLVLWLPLLLEETWAWLPPQYTFFRAPSRPMNNASRDVKKHTDAPVDGSLLQQMIRTATKEGQELIRGQVRVPFLAGQRTAAAHLAFCPSFDEAPQTEFRQISGPTARVKLTQVYPYGARFDLKLSAAATVPVSVVLDFSVAGKSIAIL